MPTAEITAIRVAKRNNTSLSLIDIKTAKAVKKIINCVLIEVNSIFKSHSFSPIIPLPFQNDKQKPSADKHGRKKCENLNPLPFLK